MAHHGLRVIISSDEGFADEFKNPYSKRHEDFNGYFRSCLISSQPKTQFEITVNLTKDFATFTEDGVLVNIACEDVSQSYWIAYDQKSVIGWHTFTQQTMWNSPSENATSIESILLMPRNSQSEITTTADWMVADEFCASDGCISVWIQRGRLDAFRDQLETYEWSPRDPPTANRYIPARLQIIRDQWFNPLRSENGHPYLFEFRNTNLDTVNLTPMEAADEFDPWFDEVDTTDDTGNGNLASANSDTDTSDDGRYDISSEDNIGIAQTRSGRKRNSPDSGFNSHPKRPRLEQARPAQHVALNVEKRALRRITRKHGESSRRDSTPEAREDITRKGIKSSPAFLGETLVSKARTDKAIAETRLQPRDIFESSTFCATNLAPTPQFSNSAREGNDKGDSTTSQALQPSQQPSHIATQPDPIQATNEEDIEDLEDQLEEVRLRRAIRAAKRKKAARS